MTRVLALILAGISALTCNAFADDLFQAESGIFRVKATKAPKPEYPGECMRRNQEGKVIADVIVNKQGAVESVKILEATGDAMSSSVSTALGRWQFSPFISTTEGAMRVVGRLVFYFKIDRGKAVVIDAAEQLGPGGKH